MKKAEKIINWIVLALGVVMIAYYLALGIAVRFGQSLQFLWLLAGLICIGRALYWLWADRRGRYPSRRLVIPLRVAIAACLVVFLLVEGIILCAGFTSAAQELDYIVVLGARVNGREPSGALRNRIEVAAEYALANPDTLVIASGGQGEDEGISEAECIRRGLVARGIPEERILLESLSTSTRENLRFSLEKLENPDELSIGVVTNNFHVFRAMKIARSLHNGETYAVPVATSLFSLPHYLLREFFATCVGFVTGAW